VNEKKKEEESNMTPNDLEATPKQKAERHDETTRPGAYFQPAVDIFETKDELVLAADMPGVPPDGVKIDLEGDELMIEGRVRSGEYDGLKPLHVEYGVGGYYRRFMLGETIDREKIKAQMKNGVLVLKLPKAERARARRISVEAA
jgi:HSP20 family protein